jgi:dihydropteroate synthase
MLGVVNITPNSFSDGGFNLESKNLIETLKFFNNYQDLIWDIGFESTAPMNQAIDENLERVRFLYFFETLKNNKLKIPNIISIDSYKLSNYEFFYDEIKKLNSKAIIIFNDVSGVVEAELINFLIKNPDSLYIFCSTKIPNRKNVLDHMKYAEETSSPLKNIVQDFIDVYELFKYHGISERLIFDPGFGFSKTFEQNWKIIDHFEVIGKNLTERHIANPILIGLSKKSFLHRSILNSLDPKADSEFIHYKLIQDLRAKSSYPMLFRVHNPEIFPQKV